MYGFVRGLSKNRSVDLLAEGRSIPHLKYLSYCYFTFNIAWTKHSLTTFPCA